MANGWRFLGDRLSRKKGKPPVDERPPQENLCYPCPCPVGQLMGSVLPQTNSLHYNTQSEGKALPFPCMRAGMCEAQWAMRGAHAWERSHTNPRPFWHTPICGSRTMKGFLGRGQKWNQQGEGSLEVLLTSKEVAVACLCAQGYAVEIAEQMKARQGRQLLGYHIPSH